ncbi:MAG: hypothetical protein ACLQMO_09365 [Acidobacteriaceae bacterium]
MHTWNNHNNALRLAHSLILYKYFRQPSKLIDGGDSRQAAGWAAALGEPFEQAIQRLIEQGYLLPAQDVLPLANLLEFTSSAIEIKSRLRTKNLKVSGRKSELAVRLAENDPDGALARIRDLNLYVCSVSGCEQAEAYAECRRSASEEALRAFRSANYAEAISLAERFRLALGFPKNPFFDSIAPPEWFECLATTNPTIFNPLPRDLLRELRQEVAMDELRLEMSQRKKWDTPEGSHFRLERVFAKNMLYFATNHNYQVAQALRIGVKQFRISNSKNFNSPSDAPENPCAFCTSLDGTIWDINSMPEIPHPNCTHIYGCRCLVRPIFNR